MYRIVSMAIIFIDIVVEFDPVEYGPVVEGPLRSVSFRIVARAPPAQPITVLFSTRSQTALGIYGCMSKTIVIQSYQLSSYDISLFYSFPRLFTEGAAPGDLCCWRHGRIGGNHDH